MDTPARRLRESVDGFWRVQAAAELEWLRHGRIEEPWHRYLHALFGDEGRELWQSSSLHSELSPEQLGWLGQQRAAIAATAASLEARPLLKQLLTTALPVGSHAQPIDAALANLLLASSDSGRQLHAQGLAFGLDAECSQLFEHKQRIDAAFLEHLPAPVDNAALHALAGRVLHATDDAAAELGRRAVRAVSRSDEPSWANLLAALRRPELEGFADAKQRPLRLSGALRRLGFEREMNQRMRVERSARLLVAQTRVVQPAAVHDARIVVSSVEYGVLSDLHVSESIGRALGAILVSPELPVELRWLLPQSAASTLGPLCLQLRADRTFLRRSEGMSPRDAELVARHATLLLVFLLRVDAVLLLTAAEHARDPSERRERLVQGLRRALGVELPPGLAALAWLSASVPAGDLASRMCGLACHVGLRERFDADWFHNPRASEPLRGACARGNTLTGDAFCAELGTGHEHALERLVELIA